MTPFRQLKYAVAVADFGGVQAASEKISISQPALTNAIQKIEQDYGMKIFLRDQSLRHDLIDACLSLEEGDDLALSLKKSFALSDFIKTSDGANLIQGFKRANNILLQAEQKDGVEYSYGADLKYAEEGVEQNLFHSLDSEEAKIRSALEREDFVEAMNSMANLRAPIDSFFETVQINSDVDIIRRNRLNLLSRICKLCLSVADLTKVEG